MRRNRVLVKQAVVAPESNSASQLQRRLWGSSSTICAFAEAFVRSMHLSVEGHEQIAVVGDPGAVARLTRKPEQSCSRAVTRPNLSVTSAGSQSRTAASTSAPMTGFFTPLWFKVGRVDRWAHRYDLKSPTSVRVPPSDSSLIPKRSSAYSPTPPWSSASRPKPPSEAPQLVANGPCHISRSHR